MDYLSLMASQNTFSSSLLETTFSIILDHQIRTMNHCTRFLRFLSAFFSLSPSHGALSFISLFSLR